MTDKEFARIFRSEMGWEERIVQDESLPMEYPICLYHFADGSNVTAVCPEIPEDAVPKTDELSDVLCELFDMDAVQSSTETVYAFYAPEKITAEELPPIQDAEALNTLLALQNERDRLWGEVTAQDDFTVCIMENGRMMAAAGAVLDGGRIADLSLCVHPDRRGCGLGRRAAAALIRKIQQAGCVPLYRTEEINDASVRLARSIGLRIGYTMEGTQLHFPNP